MIKNKITKLLLPLAIICLFSNSSFANSDYPISLVRTTNSRALLHSQTPKPQNIFYTPTLAIRLGDYKSSIVEEYRPSPWIYYDRNISGYSKNYNIVTGIPKEFLSFQNNVIREINVLNNNICIGYLLLDPIKVEMPKTDTSILKMKSLPEVKSGSLFNSLKNYKYITFKIYEKEHDGYIERYIFSIEGNSTHVLEAEMFYPKELDKEFKSEIIRSLNMSMEIASIYYKYALGEISESAYYKFIEPVRGDLSIDYLKPSNNNHNEGKDKSKDKNSGSRDDDKKIGK